MLMSAGLGTRLRPFTAMAPKPLLPVLGIPIAQYCVDRLETAGVRSIVANYHHLPEISRSGFALLERKSAELRLSDESSLLLGSAGGIARARKLLGDEPFFLINGDVLCDVDLKALATRHAQLRSQWGVSVTLAVFPRGPAGGKYTELHLDPGAGLLTGIGSKAERRPFFVGSAVIEHEALRGVDPDAPGEFVPLILERAIRERKAGVFLSDGLWLDIGDPGLWLESHLSLMSRLETGRLPTEWRRRIENVNARLAPGVWVATRQLKRRYTMDWAGPCYWSSEDLSIPNRGECPRFLGPRAVMYGMVPREDNDTRFVHGIGFGGEWISVPETGAA